ncbi:CMD domain-containing protein [Bradyrhizobium sp. HKCCYLS1011]|uniref:CMD domain-containing protein n=1 Tax=Bradyrhizobium sp. HKCCYLS1011 TaxID=3420733 RepID=UPI003EBD3995
MTTLIEKLAGVPPDSKLGAALKVRAEVLRLSEAAHDAVLVPREPGGLSHALRAALASRMCRHLGNAALVAHYDGYLAHGGDAEVAPLALPGGSIGDPRQDAMARHADMLTLAPREATRGDIEALKAAGVSEPDIVRLSELAAFVNYQLRVIAGLMLLKEVEGR